MKVKGRVVAQAPPPCLVQHPQQFGQPAAVLQPCRPTPAASRTHLHTLTCPQHPHNCCTALSASSVGVGTPLVAVVAAAGRWRGQGQGGSVWGLDQANDNNR